MEQGYFANWRRSKRSIGGYHLGRFEVVNVGIHELTEFYNTWIGHTLEEYTYGITSYSGLVWQLDLIKNGINYRRTLDPRFWHNRVKIKYTDPDGAPGVIDWSENTDSSGVYGEMEYIKAVGETTSAGATGEQDRELKDFAWPRSRVTGSINVNPSPLGEGNARLLITIAGFGATMNWQYRETAETAGVSTLITTLVGETEFVTAGRIEANSLSVRVGGATIGRRIGDLIADIISEGNASGDIYKGGVYANKEFIYEPAPTNVEYELRDGRLYNVGGVQVTPSILNPGFYVRDSNAPTGMQPTGTSNIWDDPQVHYCDEVEYIWPDRLRLKFANLRSFVAIADKEQIDTSGFVPSGPQPEYPFPSTPSIPSLPTSGAPMPTPR
jgi:hypothetical protein